MKFLISVVLVLIASTMALADSYSVHPGDDVAAVVRATPGWGPITFAPGNYVLTTNPNGAAAVWPTGRHYVGNGAVLALSGGIAPNDNQELISLAGSNAVTEFSGFVCTCAQVHCENGAYNVHDNTFKDGHRGLFVAAIRNSHFDRNAFSSLDAEGVYGYPGNGNTYNNNTFDAVYEPIHLVANCDSSDISGNVITHATRIGIELQKAMTHLSVNNNWMSDWMPHVENNTDSHMGISCATGSGAKGPPWSGQGGNITISGNTIIQNGPNQARDLWAKSAIEIMGDLNIRIANNYVWNWGNFILNGATNPGPTTTGNAVVGGGLFANDNVAWPIAVPQSSQNNLYDLNDPAAPAWPAKPAAASTTPATNPSPQSPTPQSLAPATIPATSPVDATTTTPATASSAPTVTHTNALSVDGKVVWQQQVFSDGLVKAQ